MYSRSEERAEIEENEGADEVHQRVQGEGLWEGPASSVLGQRLLCNSDYQKQLDRNHVASKSNGVYYPIF